MYERVRHVKCCTQLMRAVANARSAHTRLSQCQLRIEGGKAVGAGLAHCTQLQALAYVRRRCLVGAIGTD